MSDTDSFIDEVNDELRRDRLYGMVRRYGWIAALAVVLIVGGAAWSEYRKAQVTAAAQATGDAILQALRAETPAGRAGLLATIETTNPQSRVIVEMLASASAVEANQPEAAMAALQEIASSGEVPEIYRQIATFKILTLRDSGLSASDRRAGFEAIAQPGSAFRLLSEEQLALMDIEALNPDAAIARYQSILQDAEVSADLQQRALQVIVALGGTPDLGRGATAGN